MMGPIDASDVLHAHFAFYPIYPIYTHNRMHCKHIVQNQQISMAISDASLTVLSMHAHMKPATSPLHALGWPVVIVILSTLPGHL